MGTRITLINGRGLLQPVTGAEPECIIVQITAALLVLTLGIIPDQDKRIGNLKAE